MNRPVNALVVGNDVPVVMCSLHDDYVEETQVIFMHGGRGRESKFACFACMWHSAEVWRETGCEFCVMTADRIQGAIQHYIDTGEPFTLPSVPTEELPPHRADCRFVHDTLPGQAQATS